MIKGLVDHWVENQWRCRPTVCGVEITYSVQDNREPRPLMNMKKNGFHSKKTERTGSWHLIRAAIVPTHPVSVWCSAYRVSDFLFTKEPCFRIEVKTLHTKLKCCIFLTLWANNSPVVGHELTARQNMDCFSKQKGKSIG